MSPPPRRNSSSTSVEDLIALKDDKVLEAIGAIFESKLNSVYQKVCEQMQAQQKEIIKLCLS